MVLVQKDKSHYTHLPYRQVLKKPYSLTVWRMITPQSERCFFIFAFVITEITSYEDPTITIAQREWRARETTVRVLPSAR